ncbi:MAG: amidohydrolase family protein [Planctomycetota bacterium]|jgi:guanine deaminase
MIIQGRLLTSAREAPEPGWVLVADARIAQLGRGDPPEAPAAGDAESIICPGFIDAHVHLPQIGIRGCDGSDLLEWLDEVVFPAEMRWQDQGVADREAGAAYGLMLRAGTLGYAGYLSSHLHSAVAVTRAANRVPLRGIAGQVLMDRQGPEALLLDPSGELARLARSERGRLALSVNPRFAVSCTDQLLARAGATAASADNVFIQTHLSESRRECALVRELFPGDPHYTGVYDRHGLLTERTLLAHCVHLDEDEWRLIAERRSVVVHCPGANTFLGSGLFDLDAARSHEVRLALGSDVAAGCDLAMPRVGRAMIEVAKVRAMTGGPDGYVPTAADVWELITRGNADALGFADGGRLEQGAAADLLVLKPPFAVDRHLIGRLVHTWRDDYITHRVVNGRLI